MKQNVYTKEVAKDILETFEDLLEENNISIPDKYREGDDYEARLYGATYDDLLTKVECMIIELMEETLLEDETRPGLYHLNVSGDWNNVDSHLDALRHSGLSYLQESVC